MTFHTSNTIILFELSFDIQTIVIIKKTKETTKRDCGIRNMKRHYAVGLSYENLFGWHRLEYSHSVKLLI